jgi:hypothetical protein
MAAGAVQESAVLITEDNILKKDAQKYLECETPSEALKRLYLGIRINGPLSFFKIPQAAILSHTS